jgi:hypothetical protein
MRTSTTGFVVRCAVWMAAAALTTGCASIAAPQASDDGIDHERMSKIETAAKATGVKVFWINPPRKRG